MRAGSHPLKKQGKLDPPKDITVQMVTFIPFLSGYFEQSLDVLKFSLESLWENTSLPFDLMVFDNGSCAEVRGYLLEQFQKHKIQFLYLSDENVGLPGAWNALFRAAPGKIIAYSDSDIYFYPGWLEACLKVIETYPHTGMVTGIPVRNPPQYNSRTLEWAQTSGAPVEVARGCLMPWDIYWAHVRSLGHTEEEARKRYASPGEEDTWLTYQGLQAGIGAGHFQFVSPREALNSAAPFPYVMPMGNERYLDDQINQAGYLRLTTTGMFVRHIGNRLTGDGFDFASDVQKRTPAGLANKAVAVKPARRSFRARLLNLPPVRRTLLAVYNIIFRLYYDRK